MIKYHYSLIRLTADKVRNETINVGIAIFKDNYVDVHMLQDRQKLRVITNELQLEDLKAFAFNLSEVSLNIKRDDLQFLFSNTAMHLDGNGYFQIETEEQYKYKVADMLTRFVEPPLQIRNSKPRNSRIITQVKNLFSQYDNLISDDVADISNHKLILNYPIEDAKGLRADMLLKNSIYHLTETIEFSTDNIKKNLERSALKALTISEAKNSFESLHSFLVYSLSAEEERKNRQQLNLLSSYANELINLKDDYATSRYISHILQAAGASSL
ncbi:DUF3037 domain-containing protein [Gallibacterium anatis]|uniref:DUF3037 domain-containing protein n=1 Tax=Gallibacterium anatis TaxID=750 RepID=UPI000B9FAF8F|nr:DUF3037 domain-containing protein [Gallibacterium anatis]OZN49394.1 hypothetical protein CF595_05375 [Gallibacterium anatis]